MFGQPVPPKRTNTGLIVAIVVSVLIVVAGCATAGVVWAVKKSQVKTVAIGTTVAAKASDGSKADVTVSDAQSNGDDITVSIDIVCHSGTFPVNPFFVELIGPDGHKYSIDFLADDTDSLPAGDIDAGQEAKGTVSFTAPESVLSGGKVEVDAPLHAVAYWRLNG